VYPGRAFNMRPVEGGGDLDVFYRFPIELGAAEVSHNQYRTGRLLSHNLRSLIGNLGHFCSGAIRKIEQQNSPITMRHKT